MGLEEEAVFSHILVHFFSDIYTVLICIDTMGPSFLVCIRYDDIEALVSDDYWTDEEENESDGASWYLCFYSQIYKSHLIAGIIDDRTPIASGSGIAYDIPF